MAQGARAGVLLGRPILIVYSGAGHQHAAQLRAQLSRRGWAMTVANWRAPAPRITTVRYAPSAQRVAQALARSLRMPVSLERCQFRCSGVTIFVARQEGWRRTATLTGPSRKVG
jgi:hypothetical protein